MTAINIVLLVYQLLQDFAMPFQKNNKVGFTSENPLDKTPVCFKVRQGVREKLMAVPDWQGRLRNMVDSLIQEEKPS
jgi:hypothetical protein